MIRPVLARLAVGLSLGLAGCVSYHPAMPPGAPAGATFVVLEGTPIRYVDVGEGPPVVLVHGFGASLDSWKPVIPELAKTHRVLALDLKGFGFSGRPAGDYSPAAEARIVRLLMDARGIDKAAVVGHSWGSSVALALALDAPERVTRIALYGAWIYEEELPPFVHWSRAPVVGELLFSLYYGDQPEMRAYSLFYDKEKYVTESYVEEVERVTHRPGSRAAGLAATRGMRFAEMQKRYATIRQPVLLMWGREDELAPLQSGERLARDLPHARLVVYPNCGHIPMREATGATNADLIAFLAEPSS